MFIENDRLRDILNSLREYAESDLMCKEPLYNDPDCEYYEDLIIGEDIRDAKDTIEYVDAILDLIDNDQKEIK